MNNEALINRLMAEINDLRRRLDAMQRLDVAPLPSSLTTYSGTPTTGNLAQWAGAGTLTHSSYPGSAVARYSGVPTAGAISYWTGNGTVAMAPFGTADVVLLDGRSGGQRVTGVAGSGAALEVYRNMASSNTDSPVFTVIQEAATDDQPALYVRNDATSGDTGLFVKDGSGNSLVKFATYSATGSHRSVFFLQRARGSLATPGAISSGDLIGDFVFYAHDGTDFREAAKISVVSDGTPGSADMPGRMDFYTTQDGAASPVLAQRINSSQQSLFGGLTSTGGSGYLATKAGTSTNDAAVGGVLYVTTTSTGNVGTGEDTLASYTVPANTLAVNGQSLWFEAFGRFTAGNNKTVRVKFGGSGTNAVFVSSASNWTTDWHMRGRIIRTGATSQISTIHVASISSAGGGPADTVTNLNQTLSGSITFSITGEATANDDVILDGLIVGWDDVNT